MKFEERVIEGERITRIGPTKKKGEDDRRKEAYCEKACENRDRCNQDIAEEDRPSITTTYCWSQ